MLSAKTSLACFLLIIFVAGCAPLHWAVTQDPATGVVPAVAALPDALDGGLAGILGGGGVFGVLAFIATYGKTLRRLWMDHAKKKKAQ